VKWQVNLLFVDWRRVLRLGRPVAGEKLTAGRPAARFSVYVPPEMREALSGGGMIAPRVSREMALQVPAVQRARTLICGSLGTLPIRVFGPDRREVAGVTYLAPQPDPELAQSVTMARTYEDLLFEAESWWQVTKFGWHSFPVEAQHVEYGRVAVHSDQVYIDGRPVDQSTLIRFDSPNPPLLVHAARAIRTCLLLDQAAALYARDPQPLGYFSPADGADSIDDDDVGELLDDWNDQRSKNAWAYLPASLKANTLGWNPEQLQLADQRQHAVLEIARAAGLEAEDLGVSTTSRTYANREQRNQDRINFTLGAFTCAVQERLTMRDVLPRGYVTRIDYAGFLRGDTLTRMQAYEIGERVGAYVPDEVRELEDKPPLTAAQQAARAPQPVPEPAAPAVPGQPDGAQQERKEGPVAGTQRFSAEQAVRVQFEAPSAQDFQVDTSRRTITGLLLPWGKVANNGFAKWRFTEESVSWSEVNRIKLNLDHDSSSASLVGVATRLQSGSRGLMGTFKVGRGPEGDRALEKAEDGILDGFSVEVDFEDFDSWQPDPTDESVRLVRQSTLRGVALTGTPAFDDARLTSVKASRDSNQKGHPMTATAGKGQPDAAFDFDGYMSGLADKITDSHKQLTEGLAASLGDSFSAGMKAALETINDPQGDGPQPVRAARYTVTREEPVYRFDGLGNSLVRDAWYSCRERDSDATERLRKYRMQTEDVAKLANNRISSAQFSPQSTSTASQVVPPGYRPDLYVPQLQQGRPMVSAASQGTISNATPFVVPVFGSATSATADHVEGTNPSDGTLTFTTKTVTPGAVSGRLVLTREIVDSSNPAIDAIAIAAMNESYARQTEAKVYTLLNGANGAAGTITSGLVPSGAQAATYVGSTGTPPALIAGIRARLAAYPFNRFASPTISLMGQNATTILATSVDTTGRPIFPSIGATNTSGIGNAVTQGWNVDGLAFIPAWAVTGVAAGDTQIFTLNRADLWVWESPLLTFRFEEKQGPANIELNVFGYFATHLLRPVGLSGIRIT
jgi:HK97 family phage prohead protease